MLPDELSICSGLGLPARHRFRLRPLLLQRIDVPSFDLLPHTPFPAPLPYIAVYIPYILTYPRPAALARLVCLFGRQQLPKTEIAPGASVCPSWSWEAFMLTLTGRLLSAVHKRSLGEPPSILHRAVAARNSAL